MPLSSLQQNLLTMEQIVTVEETQIKDKKCILLRIKGGKQFVLQCEVGQLPQCSVVLMSLSLKKLGQFGHYIARFSLFSLNGLNVCLYSSLQNSFFL